VTAPQLFPLPAPRYPTGDFYHHKRIPNFPSIPYHTRSHHTPTTRPQLYFLPPLIVPDTPTPLATHPQVPRGGLTTSHSQMVPSVIHLKAHSAPRLLSIFAFFSLSFFPFFPLGRDEMRSGPIAFACPFVRSPSSRLGRITVAEVACSPHYGHDSISTAPPG